MYVYVYTRGFSTKTAFNAGSIYINREGINVDNLDKKNILIFLPK